MLIIRNTIFLSISILLPPYYAHAHNYQLNVRSEITAASTYDLESDNRAPISPPEDLGHSLELDIMDYPTIASLHRLIEKYWPFLDDIYIKRETGGSSTGAMFSVSHNVAGIFKKIFFIKIAREQAKDAWLNIVKVQQSAVGKLCSQKNTCSPVITTAEKIFSYQDDDNQSHTIEVLHAAKGHAVSSILDSSQPFNEKILCALEVGKALGTFHQAFMICHNCIFPETWYTLTHGDFHMGNVFFYTTPTYSRVYFIDNETMALSLAIPQKIDKDIITFFFDRTTRISYFLQVSDKTWHDIALFAHSFIKGYVQSFPRDKREIVICYLQHIINHDINVSLYSNNEEVLENTQSSRRLKLLEIQDNNLAWYVLPQLDTTSLQLSSPSSREKVTYI